jgi:hypothetical protein
MRWLIPLALLAACAALIPQPLKVEVIPHERTPEPTLPVPPIPPETPKSGAQVGRDIRDPGSAVIAILTPAQIGTAATQAKTDANSYVSWHASKPDNIERMASLVSALDEAVARMREHDVGGKYPPTDVLAARTALHDLRLFLSTKDDGPATRSSHSPTKP